MHLLSRVGTFQGRKAASHLVFEFCRANIDWLCCVALNNSISLFHVLISFSHAALFPVSPLHSRCLSPCLTFVYFVSSLPTPPPLTHYLFPPASYQWPYMPSVRSILPAWWCVWCWHWLRWCACCLQWLSPVSLSITWETTQRGRNPLLKTAAMRTTRGILGIFMTRYKKRQNNCEMHIIYRNNAAFLEEIFIFFALWIALQQVMLLQCI